MLPSGKKSLYEIFGLYDPADRLTNAATLLEYCLAQLDPTMRRADGAAPTLSERIRHRAGQLPAADRLQQAVRARNSVVHAQGRPPSEAEMVSAARALMEAVAGLLPSLAPSLALAVRGRPPADAQSPAPYPAVNFRGLVFKLDERDANGQWGLSLFVTFMARDMRGRTGIIRLSFFDNFGIALPDLDRRDGNDRGEVELRARFTPQNDRVDYLSVPLFMPYEQLHVARGRHTIHCRASALLVDGRQNHLLPESCEASFSVRRTGDDYSGGVG